MAITVGTDTYISLVDARAYALANDLTLPDDDTEAETLLKRAAKALDRRYGHRYLGYKQTSYQPMAWPRNINLVIPYRGEGESYNYTIDSDGNPRDFSGIPTELGEAQVEFAALIDAGNDPLVQSPGVVLEMSESIGPLSSSKKFATPFAEPLYQTVAVILRPLLVVKSGIKMVRGA